MTQNKASVEASARPSCLVYVAEHGLPFSYWAAGLYYQGTYNFLRWKGKVSASTMFDPELEVTDGQ